MSRSVPSYDPLAQKRDADASDVGAEPDSDLVSISADLPPQVESAAAKAENLVGDYILVRELARGGVGVVYLAWQTGLSRFVALKLLQRTTPVGAQRFVREAQVIAQLSHPNIVPVYEAGEHQGQPYLVMQLIKGRMLSDLRLPVRRALEVTRDAAFAVHYAHEKGIIHRDLKPQNMMLDQAGHLWVMDFGLARPLEAGATVTLQGNLVGTPEFMAPEQARAALCDARTDVYALGASLYSLLVDQPPFTGKGAYEVIDKVLRSDPTPIRHLNAEVPLEVEAIVAKAMARAPAGRYASALALADDIQNFLTGTPISARPVTAVTRASKWVRRHPTLAGLFATVLLSLLVLSLGAFAYAVNMARARHDAEARLADSLTAQGDALGLAGRWSTARARYEEAGLLQAKLGLSKASTDLGFLDAEYNSPAPLWVAKHHDSEVRALAFTSDSKHAISGSFDGSVKMIDLKTGQLSRVLRGEGAAVYAIALTPGDEGIVVADASGHIALLDLASGRQRWRTKVHDATVRALSMSADGQRIASGGKDGRISVTSLAAGLLIHQWHTGSAEVRTLKFVTGDQQIISGGGSTVVTLWDAQNGQVVREFSPNGTFVMDVTAVDDEERLFVGTFDHQLRLWNLKTGKLLNVLNGHGYAITHTAWLPGMKRVVTSSLDGTVKVWDLKTGLAERTLTGLGNAIMGAAVSPDERFAVVGDREGRLQLLRIGARLAPSFARQPSLTGIFPTVGAKVLVTQGPHNKLTRWDVATGNIMGSFEIDAEPLSFTSVSADGRRAAVLNAGGALSTWDLRTKQRLWHGPGNIEMRTLVYNAHNDSFWGWNAQGQATAVAVKTGVKQEGPPSPVGPLYLAVASGDNQTVLLGGMNSEVAVVDMHTLAPLRKIQIKRGVVAALAMSRDQRRMIVSVSDPRLLLLDLELNQVRVRELIGHVGQVTQVSLSTDANTALSISSDGAAILWDLQQLKEVHSFRVTREGYVGAVAFPGAGGFAARANDVDQVLVFDFSAMDRYRKLKAAVAVAPHGPLQQAAFGRLYLDRGIADWALDAFTAAQAQGQPVSALEMARAAWKAGDLPTAEAQFRKAIGEQLDDVPYLQDCLQAVISARQESH